MRKFNKKAPYNFSKQHGYLLVEVMVAMLIMLIGVVGIAKLQQTSKAANIQAVQLSTAINLADNLIERIRSNVAGIDTYFPGDATLTLDGSTPSPGALCVGGLVCTAAQVAAYDIWEWEQNLIGSLATEGGSNTGGLVNPIVCLQRPAGGGDGAYNIAIAWRGLTQLPSQQIPENSNASTCGTGIGAGAYDASGNDNVYRRIHWQQIFLDV